MTEAEYWANRIAEQLHDISEALKEINNNFREIGREAKRLEIYLQNPDDTAEQ